MSMKPAFALLPLLLGAGCSGIEPTEASPPPPALTIAHAACDAAGVSQIVLADSTGAVRRAITQGPRPSWFPAWSPDGTRLLFTREGNPGPPEVWITRPDGSDTRALVSVGANLAGSWSPDGARIAYAHRPLTGTNGFKIHIANADGSQARALTGVTDPDIDENVPRWSPDGARIAYTSNLRGRYEIWVAEVATGEARPLTTAYFDAALAADIEQKVPAWSPDGRQIAYWAGVEMHDPRRDMPRDVWVMQSDGTGQRRLVPGDDPNWSPNGTYIIHSTIGGTGPALGVVRPDGTGARTLLTVQACRALQSSWGG